MNRKVASYDTAMLKSLSSSVRSILLLMFVCGDCMAMCMILCTYYQWVWLKHLNSIISLGVHILLFICCIFVLRVSKLGIVYCLDIRLTLLGTERPTLSKLLSEVLLSNPILKKCASLFKTQSLHLNLWFNLHLKIECFVLHSCCSDLIFCLCECVYWCHYSEGCSRLIFSRCK